MSAKTYIGINDKARKVKKMYVGIDNIARRVKRAYLGINNVARCIFDSTELYYYGTATDLSVGRSSLAATTIGDYALFSGGGKNNSSDTHYAIVEQFIN